MKALFLFLFSMISFAEEAPRWSVEKLNGVVSYHAGANCFNGALAAAGYVDDLQYMSGAEFKFFVSRFCGKNVKPPKKGDLFVISSDGNLDHAAIYLDDSHVFEKPGMMGFHSDDSDIQDPDARKKHAEYQVNTIKASLDFQACGKSCVVNTYHCAKPGKVRALLSKCDERLNQLNTSRLSEELNAITLNPDRVAVLSDSAIQTIEDWASALDHLNEKDFCSLYILTKGISIYQGMANLRSGLHALSGPNVRPDERPPAMPAAAKQHTQEGALAFAGYFIRALDWSIATTDPTSLEAMSAPGCKACHSYITELNKLRAEGGRIQGGRMTLSSASADPSPRDRPSEYQIAVKYVQDPDYVIRPSSLPSPDGTASKTYRSLVLLRWIATAWQTVELEG